MFRRPSLICGFSLLILACCAASAQQPPASIVHFAPEDAAFVAYAQPVIAITHAQIIDGTGAAPRRDMTVIVRDGRIAAVGTAKAVKVPAGATIIDGSGKTLLPGFVMVHEHMFYPSTRPGAYTQLPYSFSRLYLAGGTTTMRTAGTLSADADLNIRRAIDAGMQPGPDIDVTGPYIGGPSEAIPAIPHIDSPEEAARVVRFWAEEGATSFKVYMEITRDELKAVVREAHARGLKVTGHLCSVTYREAAEIGIDNIEHDFEFPSDFVADKKPDVCPDPEAVESALARLDPDGPEIGALIDTLVSQHVALTSTLAIFATLAAGEPKEPDAVLDLLAPQLRESYENSRSARQSRPIAKLYAELLPRLTRMQRRFVVAGGLLMSGTDPTGYGGVLPGFSARQQLALLVKGGFTFPQAVQISTLNGARFLGREQNVGSIETGKRADLQLIDGDPVADLAALDRLSVVFKAGIGYRTQIILDSLKGKVGLY
jgi:imidazolonepropionase-like amidohydrolase